MRKLLAYLIAFTANLKQTAIAVNEAGSTEELDKKLNIKSKKKRRTEIC